jgi:hypothetical protein
MQSQRLDSKEPTTAGLLKRASYRAGAGRHAGASCPHRRTWTQLSCAVGQCRRPYRLPPAQSSVTSASGGTVHTATSLSTLGWSGRDSMVDTWGRWRVRGQAHVIEDSAKQEDAANGSLCCWRGASNVRLTRGVH